MIGRQGVIDGHGPLSLFRNPALAALAVFALLFVAGIPAALAQSRPDLPDQTQGAGSPARASETITIPLGEIIIFRQAPVPDPLATREVPAHLRGRECTVHATAKNQASVNPGNDIIVSAGNGSVTLSDVEREGGVRTEADGAFILGERIAVRLIKPPSNSFSASIDVVIDCAPPVVQPESRVTEIVVDEVTSPAFDGASYGDVGQYETIAGRAFGILDPEDPRNAIIQDIELAPTNADGFVEYEATFFLVKPIDMSRSSGLLWHYVPNRGGRITLPANLREQGDIGLSSGWQGDNAGGTAHDAPGREWVRVPIAKNPDGSAITGEILGRIINAEGVASSQIFVHSNPLPYEPRTLDTSEATLTIIESETVEGETGVTREVPSDEWAWATCTEDDPFPGTPSPHEICVDGGFEPNRVYQVVFTAEDPPVLGVGFAAFRDVGSFFKFQGADDEGNANPLGADGADWVLAQGNSQSGNMLRQFVHLGFNEDTAGRQVQDGQWVRIAGRRVALNFRWAMPDGVLKLYEPGSEGPQWWAPWPDETRGLPTRGILDRCTESDTCPKIIEHLGSAELWGLKASPGWVGTDAAADIPLPPEVRRYYIPSTRHGGGTGSFDVEPPGVPDCPSVGFGRGTLPDNPVPHAETRNAIEFHFRNWVMQDIAPPPSEWPRLADGDLVEPTKEAMGFPDIPGLPEDAPTGLLTPVFDYDFGPEFDYSDGSGVPTVVPPEIKQVIPSLVPRVDEDGNEVGGVPVVLRDAPLGSYFGWNIVDGGFHDGKGCGYAGGMVPFATTRAERLASGDPRLSLEERYGDHAGYVAAVEAAAANAVASGFLLPDDAERLIQQAMDSDVLRETPSGSVTNIVVTDTMSPTFEGMSFGDVGQYEYVFGYVEGELDPDHPRNATIVNLDRAPRNADGNVEYRVDLQILKPVDMSRGNGAVVYDTLNRGNKRALGHRVNGGPNINDAFLAEHTGTGFLMNEGYTVVWSAWEAHVAPGDGRMLADFPVATHADGSPIIDIHREEFIFGHLDSPATGDLHYPAATLDTSEASLTVRQYERDPRVPVDTWEYVDDSQISIDRPEGFDAGAIYEFIYPARDPIVLGMGLAAISNVVSELRYGEGDENPLAGAVDHTFAIGLSQPGRVLGDLIYEGFNGDEAGRPVFDGVIRIIPGSRKSAVNVEFGITGNYSRQHENHTFPGDQFPFTYETLTDPISGRTDGILARCEANDTCPKVFHFDSDSEIYQARGSLVVTDTTGQPLTLPDNVRAYLMAGSQHSPAGSATVPAQGQFPTNPLQYDVYVRGLLTALHEWASDGTPPPDSRYPMLQDGTLVAPDAPEAQFPEIPGHSYTGLLNELRLLDHSVQPPAEGPSYPVFVGAKDADGNNIAGVRHPFLEVPTATHTGWNLRREGFAEGALLSTTGSYLPFARTEAERLASGDERLSLEERYRNHGAYVSAVARSANAQVRDRLLLPEDADRIIEEAAESDIGKPPKRGRGPSRGRGPWRVR